MKTNSLYHCIYQDIKDQIIQGKLKPGDQLPAEAELEKLYRTSRAPVRQALSMLEHEAFLDRRQGRGTFVCDRKKQSHWLFSSGFASDMERDFDFISSKVLYIRLEKPDDDIRRTFALDGDQQVIHIHRLRYFKNSPIFLIDNYLKDSFNIEKFKRATDFFLISEVLEADFQISLYKAEEEIRASVADSRIAKEMEIPNGYPILDIKRVNYTENERIVYVSRYKVCTDRWAHRAAYYSKGQCFD